ncbi:hypothetical protein PMAYCL1PPCAC_25231, partial [Pristionchus mayeri]
CKSASKHYHDSLEILLTLQFRETVLLQSEKIISICNFQISATVVGTFHTVNQKLLNSLDQTLKLESIGKLDKILKRAIIDFLIRWVDHMKQLDEFRPINAIQLNLVFLSEFRVEHS